MGAMGRNLVLGCPRAKDFVHVRPNAGMVKVMKWLEAEEKWVGKGSPIYGNTTNIMAGIRVSMSGDSNTMAFIAPGMDDDDPAPGRVRVFNFEDSEDGDWVPMGEPIVNLDPNDLRAPDRLSEEVPRPQVLVPHENADLAHVWDRLLVVVVRVRGAVVVLSLIHI